MPSPNHYFQFRHRDWLSSSTVRRMSLAERGAYIELLSYQWEDGFIPDDIEELSRMIGVSLADFRKLWPRLEQSFPLAEIGKRVNPVMEKDRIEAERKRDQLIQNGTKGGRPKKPKEKQTEKQKETKQKPNGFLLLNQNESKSKAIPDTDTDTYTVTKVTEGQAGKIPEEIPFDPPEPKPKPYDVAKDALCLFAEAIGQPEPSNVDIRRHLKPTSGLQQMVSEFGQELAVRLAVEAFSEWKGRFSWEGLHRQRYAIKAKVDGKFPVHNGGMVSTAMLAAAALGVEHG